MGLDIEFGFKLTRDELISEILQELEDMRLSGKRKFLENLSDKELLEFRFIIMNIQLVRYSVPIDRIGYIIDVEPYEEYYEEDY